MTRETVHELGSEVAHVRDELDVLLGELDRRRHEVLDVPLQLRRHALGAGLTVLAFTLAAAGSVGLTIWRRERIRARTGRLSQAIARMTEHPERVATESTIPAKIVTAAVSAIAAALVKKLLERGVTALANGRSDRPAMPPVNTDGVHVSRGLQRFANSP